MKYIKSFTTKGKIIISDPLLITEPNLYEIDVSPGIWSIQMWTTGVGNMYSITTSDFISHSHCEEYIHPLATEDFVKSLTVNNILITVDGIQRFCIYRDNDTNLVVRIEVRGWV